jgi:hypothetical protein
LTTTNNNARKQYTADRIQDRGTNTRERKLETKREEAITAAQRPSKENRRDEPPETRERGKGRECETSA